MAMIDVKDAMRQRAEALIEGDPDLSVRFRLYSGNFGDVGFLTIMTEDERIIGVEYFESEDSWKRPNAINDYRNASSEGFPVAVVVPHDAWQAFNERMQREGAEGFCAYDYTSFGIRPRITA